MKWTVFRMTYTQLIQRLLAICLENLLTASLPRQKLEHILQEFWRTFCRIFYIAMQRVNVSDLKIIKILLNMQSAIFWTLERLFENIFSQRLDHKNICFELLKYSFYGIFRSAPSLRNKSSDAHDPSIQKFIPNVHVSYHPQQSPSYGDWLIRSEVFLQVCYMKSPA